MCAASSEGADAGLTGGSASGEIPVPHLEDRAPFRWFRHGCAMSGCYTAEDRAEFLRLILFFFSQLLAAPMRKTAGFGAEPQDYLRENRMNLKSLGWRESAKPATLK